MPTKYSELQIRNLLVSELKKDVNSLYTTKVVKHAGFTSDTKRLYSEVVSDELIKNFHILSSIGSGKRIRSSKPFRVAKHDGRSNVSKRFDRDGNIGYSEKGLAIALYNDKDVHIIGKIVDYEVPLNENQSDGYGNIDLLTYKANCIKLVELKVHQAKTNASDETFLRALLEIYTYYKLISGSGSVRKFIDEYSQANRLDMSLQISILTDKFSKSGETLLDIGNNPCLKKLIQKIGKDVGQPVEGYLFTYPNSGKPFCSGGNNMNNTHIYLDGKIHIERII